MFLNRNFKSRFCFIPFFWPYCWHFSNSSSITEYYLCFWHQGNPEITDAGIGYLFSFRKLNCLDISGTGLKVRLLFFYFCTLTIKYVFSANWCWERAVIFEGVYFLPKASTNWPDMRAFLSVFPSLGHQSHQAQAPDPHRPCPLQSAFEGIWSQ